MTVNKKLYTAYGIIVVLVVLVVVLLAVIFTGQGCAGGFEGESDGKNANTGSDALVAESSGENHTMPESGEQSSNGEPESGSENENLTDDGQETKKEQETVNGEQTSSGGEQQVSGNQQNATGNGQVSTKSQENATKEGSIGGGTTDTGSNQSGTGSSPTGLAAPSVNGALHVDGTKLVDKNGKQVQLRGISTHGIARYPAYINEECFAELHNTWKVNVIRLAMYTAEYNGYCSGGDKEYLKNLVRSGVKYATNQDMYVIIDWHILSDSNPKTNMSEAKKFFAEMSKEYAKANNILYEICNEPNGGTSWNDIKSYAKEIIPIIRANDPDAVILVGTPNWSQDVDQAAANPITEYKNIMYTLHFYAATHTDDLRNRMVNAVKAGLPVFVSEYGICDASGNGGINENQANKWVEVMDSYGISYVAWNLSNENETSAVLKSSCSKTSGFKESDLSLSGKWLYNMLRGKKESTGSGTTQTTEKTTTSKQNQTQKPTQQTTTPKATQENIVLTEKNLKITVTLVSSWEENGNKVYQYSLTLKNISGKTSNGWFVDVPFNGNITLKSGWNGNYSVKEKTLHIESLDYNGVIASDGTVNDIGFIVSGGSIALN